MKETSYHVPSNNQFYQAVHGGSDGVYGGSAGVRKGSEGIPAGPDGVPGNQAGGNVGITYKVSMATYKAPRTCSP